MLQTQTALDSSRHTLSDRPHFQAGFGVHVSTRGETGHDYVVLVSAGRGLPDGESKCETLQQHIQLLLGSSISHVLSSRQAPATHPGRLASYQCRQSLRQGPNRSLHPPLRCEARRY